MIRFLFSLIFIAVIAYFATTVPLGRKTLWQHLVAIFRTDEAKELVDGTKEEAKKLADRVLDGMKPDAGAPDSTHAPPPERHDSKHHTQRAKPP
jgi:hypothetical protein